jgi:hypothetical protein
LSYSQTAVTGSGCASRKVQPRLAGDELPPLDLEGGRQGVQAGGPGGVYSQTASAAEPRGSRRVQQPVPWSRTNREGEDRAHRYLLTVLLMAWCTLFALAPPRPRRSSTSNLSYWFGFLINELPFPAIWWLLASTLLAFGEGDVASPAGWAALGWRS